MAKSFNVLRAKMSSKAQQAANTKAKKMLAVMQLNELRVVKQFSQEKMAQTLVTKQANISRIERRTDMRISTLRNYIEAMGGQLDIVAKFPDGEIHITQFVNK